MPLRVAVVCALLSAAAPSVCAQDTRDDGIKALLRGDNAEAVRILRPLAEDTRPGDHTAQFLMALLYDSGKAVWPNSIRACALSAAAAATGGPFSEQATQLARAIREQSGGTAPLCGGGEAWRTMAPPLRLLAPIGATMSFAADGVIAIARGDYDIAVRELRALAESDLSTDNVAQFFMATLYQNGHGVPLDPLRACALYHRAARVDSSPFGVEAHQFMKALWRAHDNDWFQRCQALGNLGIGQQRDPALFDLAPGHSIAWDETGARITYRGSVSRFNFTPGSSGSILLPPRHTRLITGAARETRDFIELASWTPSARQPETVWTLNWYLAEVNGDQISIVASKSDLMRTSEPPFADRPIDLRTVIALRVNDGGAAEWSSLVAGRPAGEIVESPGDRRRRAEERAAHESALAAVDWSRTLDPSRPPSFQYPSVADGCADLTLTAFAPDRAEIIRVIVDKQGLGLRPEPRIIDLGRERRVSVSVHMYAQPRRESPFCTYKLSPTSDAIWRAIGGTMTIEMTPKGVVRDATQYRATVRLENAVFVNAAGERLSPPGVIVLSGLAGAAFRNRH